MENLATFDIEYGKIFRRLMRLEVTLKFLAKQATMALYQPDSCMCYFKNFFDSKHIKKHYIVDSKKGLTRFSPIFKSSEQEKLKLCRLIDCLYLSHIISFILNYPECRKENFMKTVFAIEPDHKILNKNADKLRLFRNSIMHFNFENYNNNKIEYLNALLVYETYFGIALIPLDFSENQGKKMTIREILEKIEQLRPDLFYSSEFDNQHHYNKDRMLVDLFDDIAVIGGWQCHELPSPWSILRQKYDLVKLKQIANMGS